LLPLPLSHRTHSATADEAEEYLRDPEDSTKMSDNTRKLGLVVLRGTTVMTISPTSGVEQIANPFTSQAQE